MFTSTITIQGRIAEDPTVLDNVTEIVVLTNRRTRNDEGEWTTSDTTRYVVKAFRRLAQEAGEQLQKGTGVIVTGSVTTDTWTDRDTGQNRYQQVLLADAIGVSL